MSEEIKRKRGRPCKANARRNPLQTKFNDDELLDIKELSIRDGKSVAEILRIGYILYKKSSDERAAIIEDDYYDYYEDDYDDYDVVYD